MFAIVETGGKQYKVAKDTVLKIEKLEGEQGKTITLDKVLMVSDGKTVSIGSPEVKGAAVTAEVLEQKKDDKVIIFKKKRRQNYRRKNGHRQQVTVIRVLDVSHGKKAAAPKAEAKTEKAAEKKAAPKKAAATKKTATKTTNKKD